MLEAEARERQHTLAGTRPNTGVPDLVEIIPEGQPYLGESRQKAADLVDVSPRYVSDAKRIKDEAPEVFKEMRGGTVTMPQARALAALPEEQHGRTHTATAFAGTSRAAVADP